MIDERFVILALVFNVIGIASYAIKTLKGTTKPNRVTWFLWALVPFIAFAAQLSKGVGWPSLMTLSVGAGPLVIFILSFFNKKAEWKISKFDIFCGAISLMAIIFWVITKDAVTAIVLSVFADFVAAIPTVVKSFYFPETEDDVVYLLTIFSAVTTFLTITNWNTETISFPAYILIINIILFVLIKFKFGKFILFRLNQSS